uniref:ORF1 n=2 Tax=Aliivibrio fischeri TaxID=668 RepID=Q6JHS7_ALIFS|nr:Abi family protein [Aliivibrio fischeri]AAS45621.1 ORF1 [Aliivibrio fischeri]
MDMTTAPLVPYKKPYLSSSQLCKKLIDQGLIIDDEDFAEKVLNRCSYYRFKAYLSPFKDKGTKKFSEHTTFHNGYELYMFDSELRSYIFDIIEKVEIGVRSALDQWITKQTDNPFWYLDASLFKSNGQQVKTVSRVRDMFVDSKEEYAKHYQEKYYNEYCPFYRDLPPAWVAIELMTFGNVVKLIQNISDDKIQSLKMDRFSKKFNIQKFQTLISWMNVLHQMRNYCGHHNRLFNRNFPAPTAIKKSLSDAIPLVRTKPNPDKREEDQLNRLYTALAALQCIYSGLGFDEKIGPKISDLFDNYTTTQRFSLSMGFPNGWKEEPLFFDL